jgi:hypothetical protein
MNPVAIVPSWPCNWQQGAFASVPAWLQCWFISAQHEYCAGEYIPTRQAIAGIAAQNSATASKNEALCFPARILHPLQFLT